MIDAGIPMPRLIDIDWQQERILKEYIDGPTILELLKNGQDVSAYLPAVCSLAGRAREHGPNIDYFPSNFVVRSDRLYYVDYECNAYMEDWDFEHWGIKYWSQTPELAAYLSSHP